MKASLLTICALCFAASAVSAQEVATAPTLELAKEKVDVGDRDLSVTCMGRGSPTVMLEAGFGDDAAVWMKVQLGAAAVSRVCAYSRAGPGESDAVTERRTIQDVVNDLNALLMSSPVEGPFVLVGHSIGGLIVNMYAHQKPEQVVGMVLVDSSHPDQQAGFQSVRPPELNAAWAVFDASNASPENWDATAGTMQGETVYAAPGSLGNLPVVVLTADTDLVNEQEVAWVRENVWSGFNEDIALAEGQVWAALQEQYATLSNNSRHLTVEGSTHYIYIDNPEVVVDAVRQVVEAFRTGAPLEQ